uniref:Uncharacterized protein n=1 Tax=Oryza glumipatula TaxID=40148 RepID=A0A0D9ZAM5_9ORYZ
MVGGQASKVLDATAAAVVDVTAAAAGWMRRWPVAAAGSMRRRLRQDRCDDGCDRIDATIAVVGSMRRQPRWDRCDDGMALSWMQRRHDDALDANHPDGIGL